MTNENKLYYKTCREQAGLTQEQAIALLGIAETATLSRYENGHAPVSQDLAATMVKVYRTPLLANWHVRYTNPALAPYLPEVTEPITDGDTALQMELADDDITAARSAVKAILRDGTVSAREAEELKVSASTLRGIANRILSAATYLECREADSEGR
jgi:transcriptional regulator with XRE-family HTH domain